MDDLILKVEIWKDKDWVTRLSLLDVAVSRETKGWVFL